MKSCTFAAELLHLRLSTILERRTERYKKSVVLLDIAGDNTAVDFALTGSPIDLQSGVLEPGISLRF